MASTGPTVRCDTPRRGPGRARRADRPTRGRKRAGAQCGPGHEQEAGAEVLGPVASCGEEPEPGQQREQHGCGGGEGSSPCAACFRDESAEGYECQDLQQEQGSAACVVTPVEFVVERAVKPRDPHHGEHRGELPQPRPVEVAGQMTCGLRDQNDDDQVVEQFQRADDTLPGLFAVGAWGPPQLAAQPGPILAVGCHGVRRAVSRRVRARPTARHGWPSRGRRTRLGRGPQCHRQCPSSPP